jgi:hypothetical protein
VNSSTTSFDFDFSLVNLIFLLHTLLHPQKKTFLQKRQTDVNRKKMGMKKGNDQIIQFRTP